MKTWLIRRAYAVYSRGIGTILFLSSLAFVLRRWGEWNEKLSSDYLVRLELSEVVVTTLRMLVNQGRYGAAFRALSLPMSSRCNGWPDATYDANLRLEWWTGKENPVRDLSLRDQFLYFFANLVARSGHLSLAWLIHKEQLESGQSTARRITAALASFDIVILLKAWQRQLDGFYGVGIWFDPDTVEGFSDSMTQLLKEVSDIEVADFLLKVRSVSLISSVAEELYGEYMEGEFRLEVAHRHYARAAAVNPDSVTARVRYRNLESLINGVDSSGMVVATIADTRSVCAQSGDEFVLVGEQESLSYSFKLRLGENEIDRQVDLDFSPHGVAHLKKVFNLGSGLLVSKTAKGLRLLEDTKHLDIRHMKLFAPTVLSYGHDKALISAPSRKDQSLIETKRAFVFPGLGWNYYHWLYETLPYLQDYDRFSEGGKIPAAFFFPLKKWHLESLAAMGYEDLNVVPYSPFSKHYFSDCYVPIHSSKNLVPSPSTIRLLRERLAKPKTPRLGKKVFLSRRKVSAIRGMQNSKQVEEFFVARGFEIVDPSRLSFTQQIEFFADVEVLAAEGGAALANLVFCPAETKVIVLSGARAWAETFTAIAGVLGQEVYVVLGESTPYPNPYYLWTAFDYAGDIDGLGENAILDDQIARGSNRQASV